ncbi:MAG: sulfatase-like hydrolase/transferase [Planctomycetaceae bacterium]|nr:sulfatase-like hydrolase/transferase [Planctomycetaceae bacterium]
MTRLCTLVALFVCLFAYQVRGEEHPHIILVMADDHGYGDTGFTGHPFVKTPNLDAMAQAGVVFNRFYASAPVCSPTRASVMTGRHPFRANVPNHGHYMRPQEATIAEALQGVGYVAGHFGKWHIGSVQSGSPTNPSGAGFDEWLSGLNFFDNDPYLSRNGHYEHLQGPGTVITMDATIEFLKKHVDGDRPMFAVTWFPSPHDPQQELPQGIDNAKSLYDDEDTKKPGYFREITLLDQQVGRLRKTLRELGIERNTFLFYCSDNGGLVPESSGGRAKKGSIYEGGLRVPAVLEWPAKYDHREINTPAFAADLYPTLVALTGAKVPHQPVLDGVNLLPIIEGRQTERKPMGFWHGHTAGQGTRSDEIIQALLEAEQAGEPNPHPERILKNVEEFPTFGDDGTRGHSAWNAWPWKLHRIENKGKVTYELYNLADDPLEQNDLVKQQTARVEKMKTELEAWQRSVLNSWSGHDYQ